MNELLPCFGTGCDVHGTCAHYHAVEFADPQTLRIGHCPKNERGSRTLYEPMFIVLPVLDIKERRAAA